MLSLHFYRNIFPLPVYSNGRLSGLHCWES
jgi:hypothetical protein